MKYKSLMYSSFLIISCFQMLYIDQSFATQETQEVSQKEKDFLEYAKSRTKQSSTPANDTLSYARSHGFNTKDIIRLAHFLNDYGYNVTAIQDPVKNKNSVNISYKAEVSTQSNNNMNSKDITSNLYDKNVRDSFNTIDEKLKEHNGYVRHIIDLTNDTDRKLQNIVKNQNDTSGKISDINQQNEELSRNLKNIYSQQKMLHNDHKQMIDLINNVKSKMFSKMTEEPAVSNSGFSEQKLLKRISDLEYILSQILGTVSNNNEQIIKMSHASQSSSSEFSSSDIQKEKTEKCYKIDKDILNKIKEFYGKNDLSDEECINWLASDFVSVLSKYSDNINQWKERYGNDIRLPELLDKALGDSRIKDDIINIGRYENSQNKDKYTEFLEKQRQERLAEINKMNARGDAIKQARKNGENTTDNTIVEKMAQDYSKATDDNKTGKTPANANGIIEKEINNSAYDEINSGREKETLIYRKTVTK